MYRTMGEREKIPKPQRNPRIDPMGLGERGGSDDLQKAALRAGGSGGGITRAARPRPPRTAGRWGRPAPLRSAPPGRATAPRPARLCAALHRPARLCTALPGSARFCTALRGSAQRRGAGSAEGDADCIILKESGRDGRPRPGRHRDSAGAAAGGREGLQPAPVRGKFRPAPFLSVPLQPAANAPCPPAAQTCLAWLRAGTGGLQPATRAGREAAAGGGRLPARPPGAFRQERGSRRLLALLISPAATQERQELAVRGPAPPRGRGQVGPRRSSARRGRSRTRRIYRVSAGIRTRCVPRGSPGAVAPRATARPRSRGIVPAANRGSSAAGTGGGTRGSGAGGAAGGGWGWGGPAFPPPHASG